MLPPASRNSCDPILGCFCAGKLAKVFNNNELHLFQPRLQDASKGSTRTASPVEAE